MPHCTPQKQQWVLTVLSASAAAPHPPAGVSLRWGPYCSIRDSSVTGSLAMAFHHQGLGDPEPLPFALGTQVQVELEAVVREDAFEIRKVHRSREALAAAAAAGGRRGLVVAAVEDHREVERPLDDVEQLPER